MHIFRNLICRSLKMINGSFVSSMLEFLCISSYTAVLRVVLLRTHEKITMFKIS
jgi:hypothetical protein